MPAELAKPFAAQFSSSQGVSALLALFGACTVVAYFQARRSKGEKTS